MYLDSDGRYWRRIVFIEKPIETSVAIKSVVAETYPLVSGNE